MISNSHIELISELRATVSDIGVDGLAKLTKAAPTDLELDAALLEKLVELLKKIVEEQELPYVRPSESKSNNVEGTDDIDPTYTYYTPIEGKDDANESPIDKSPTFDEVKISKSAFPELFPTIEITPKSQLQKSFPNIDEFDGGIHILSGGNFGLTFKSVLRGVPVVLKASKKRSEEANRADYHEWSVSERLEPHPNVLQIIGLCPAFSSPLFAETGTTALIAPLQENGGLREFFDKREPRDGDIVDIAFGMIVGIRSLHEQRVVHRDIAVRNFLVDCDGRVLLCDFGLSEFLPKGSDVYRGNSREALPWRSLAPETVADLTFSTKSDIWMYGLALMELVSKHATWPNFRRSADLKAAFEKEELPLPNTDDFPPIVSAIIRDCLQFDPNHRPSANDIAERLVKSHFKKSERDENGNLYLQRAVIQDDKSFLSSVLWDPKSPHMINKVNVLGDTALMSAKTEGIQRLLLSHRRIPPCNTEPSRIPEYFHNIDAFGSLLRLAKKGDVERVISLGRLGLREFLDEKYEQVAAYRGDTPLHVAARTGNIAMLDALISLNIFDKSKGNENGHTALHVASIHGHVGIVERLLRLQNSADTNGTQVTQKHRFVNIQDKMWKTALHLAARNGNLNVTHALLSNSTTNINIPDAKSQPPIFDSISGGAHLAILEAFVNEPRVNVNAANSNGETVLHKVARADLARAAHILIQRADLVLSSKERENGDTPLHLATRNLSPGVVEALLTREDININEVDEFGNNTLHILATHTAFSEDISDTQAASQRSHGSVDFSRSNVVDRESPRESSLVATEILAHWEVDVDASREDSVGSAREEVRRNARTQLERSTSLYDAAVEVAKLLLSIDALNVNARDAWLQTPLHIAAMKGKVKLTKLLLSRDDIAADSRDRFQRTPLHFAAMLGGTEVTKVLLSRADVDVNARDVDGKTPLYGVVLKNHVEVAKMLLSRKDIIANAVDAKQDTPLHYATSFSKHKVEIVTLLLCRAEVQPQVNHRGKHLRTPLHIAAEKNAFEVAKLLLSQPDTDVDARNAHGETPLHCASREDSVEVAKILLSRDDVDANALSDKRQTPLHSAASGGSGEVAKILLSRDDVDVNARDVDGNTPLHIAARENKIKVVKVLMSAPGVDAVARDNLQQTPLHCAASGYSGEVANFLLSKDDADVNSRDVNGRSPLHVAAAKGKSGVAEVLLAVAGVDAAARDKHQQTPLHHAAAGNSFDVAKLLLEMPTA